MLELVDFEGLQGGAGEVDNASRHVMAGEVGEKSNGIEGDAFFSR